MDTRATVSKVMVRYERTGAAALIAIDRPERRNAKLAIAAFPEDALLSDREATHAALGLPLRDGLALEARLGRERLP